MENGLRVEKERKKQASTINEWNKNHGKRQGHTDLVSS